MCRKLVTYKSNTGATGYYAWVIASELGCDRKEWSEGMDLTDYDLVIYGGGVYGGTVNGLREMRKDIRTQKIPNFVIFATGGTPMNIEKTVDTMWDLNLRGDDYSFPHFYMQSGIDYEKLPLKEKMQMKICALMMRSQMYDDCGIPFKINKSYNISDPEYADGLISYVRKFYA